MDGDEVMHTYMDIKTNGKTDQLLLTALSNTRYQRLATDTDTFIHLTNGVAISKNIADQYHLKQGDVLYGSLPVSPHGKQIVLKQSFVPLWNRGLPS